MNDYTAKREKTRYLILLGLLVLGIGVVLYHFLQKDIILKALYPVEGGAVLWKEDKTAKDSHKHFDYLERVEPTPGKIWKTKIRHGCPQDLGLYIGRADYQVSLYDDIFCFYTPNGDDGLYLLLDYATGETLGSFSAPCSIHNHYFQSIADKRTVYHLSPQDIMTAYERKTGRVLWETEIEIAEPYRPELEEEWLCLTDEYGMAAYIFSVSGGVLQTIPSAGPGVLRGGRYYYFKKESNFDFYCLDLESEKAEFLFTETSLFPSSQAKYGEVYFALYGDSILFQTGSETRPAGLKAVDMTTGETVWEVDWPNGFHMSQYNLPGHLATGYGAKNSPFYRLENPYLVLPLETDRSDGPLQIIVLDLDKGQIVTEMNPVYAFPFDDLDYSYFYHEGYFYMEIPIPLKAENNSAILSVDSRTGETQCFQILSIDGDRERLRTYISSGDFNPSLIRNRVFWKAWTTWIGEKEKEKVAAIDLDTGELVYGSSKLVYRDFTGELAAVYGWR